MTIANRPAKLNFRADKVQKVTKNYHLTSYNPEHRQFHNETEVIGQILAAERSALLERLRPHLQPRNQRPPKPVWCNVHYKYEEHKEQILCLVFQDMEAAATGERLLR